MPAPYWIHCNLCAALLSSKDTSLFMLSCNHLLCKDCMQKTDRGTKCPLCKQAIKFIDLRKIPSSQKPKFEQEVWRKMREPLKAANFQNAQQENLAKLTLDYKMKVKKAAQVHAQMKDTLARKKAQLQKMIDQRRLMQARLKEIYMKNQKKRISQKHIEEPFDCGSSSTSGISNSSKASSFFGSSKNSNSKAKIPPLALYSTSFFGESSSDKGSNAGSTMFGSTSSKKSEPHRRKSINERSQANRAPFFA